MCLILQDKYWFEHISFGSMVKFKFLAQFSLDHLSYPVIVAYPCMRKHNDNTIKTSGHSSLEKYTSHFIRKGSKGLQKVLSVRGELETEQNCNILTPFQHFPVLLGCSFQHLLSN